MNFSEQFIQIMDYIGQQLGIAIDWTTQNITPYLIDLSDRLSHFLIAREITDVVARLISLTITLIIGIYFKRKNKQAASTRNESWFFYGVASVATGIVFLFMFEALIGDVKSLIEAIYLPEKAMIEYLLEVKALIQ